MSNIIEYDEPISLEEFLQNDENFETDKIVATLVNPDDPQESGFDWHDVSLERILGAMARDPVFLPKVRHLLEPKYFRMKYHQVICRLICKYYDDYKAAPPLNIATDILNETITTNDLPIYQATLEAVYEAYEPALYTTQHFIDRIKKFAKMCRYKQCRLKEIEIHKSNMSEEMKWAEIKILNDNLDNFQDCNEGTGWLDPGSEDFTLGENREWIIEDFIARTDLMLYAAKSKAGKTILLSYMINCLLAGKPFLDGFVNVPDLPILYLDFENTRTYFGHWHGIFESEFNTRNAVAKNLRYKTKSLRPDGKASLPNYLELNWLKDECKRIEDIHGQPGLIISDTFRAAYLLTPGLDPNFECSAGSVGAILRPLQEWLHGSNWAMIMMHHLNKANSVSGSTDFWASVDSVVRHDRDVENCSPENVLTFNGRYMRPIPQKVLTFENNTFNYRGTVEQYKLWKDGREAIHFETQVARFALDVLERTNGPVNQKDLVSNMNTAHKLANHKCIKLLNDMSEMGVINCNRGKDNAKLFALLPDTFETFAIWKAAQ